MDGATKWFNKDLTNFFKDKGILTKVFTPYTVYQNKIVKKANYLVKERVRVILIKT